MAENLQQRIVHFSGDVQGVGFRYTACRVAGSFDVTGYVMNMPDGRVECVVEGDAAQIDAFLAELSHHMRRYVKQRTEQTAPHSGSFHRFDVRF